MLNKNRRWQVILPILLIGTILVSYTGQSLAASSLLKQGSKQIAGKKYKAAIRTLTKAMNSGTLSDKDMARALYKRGQAHNGQKRHSAAIADLTGALFLGKLDAKGQKKAYRQRAFAYRATGNSKLANRDESRSGQTRSRSQGSRRRAANAMSPPATPGFRTVVTPTRTRRPSRAKTSKKAAIPAFRTSIAVDQ